ncbi:MAG: glycosyltransferase family 4 protein [Sphingobium sp.]
MKIALVATHHVDYAANLAMALAARHEVLLVVSRRSAARQLRPESWPVLERSVSLRVVPHHVAPLQPWIALRCLVHIRRFGADIVHVQEHPTRSMALLARLMRGKIPLVTTVHDPEPHSGNDAKAARIFRRYNDALRKMSDGIIVHGPSLADDLAHMGLDPNRIAALPHGALRFGRHGFATAPVRVDRRRLIFFGRMEHYKGLDTLLAAHAIWREQGADIRLTIAGAGPELDRHRQALAVPGIDLHAGRLDQKDLEEMVKGCAAAILPYHDATQSGVIASALGVGRPVIVTDVGELANAVGDAGLIVPPRNPVALAKAGRRLVDEPGLLERLEWAVTARVEGELGWEQIAARTEDFYSRMIARTGG